ncbi:MBL fold metallo-hydrolase [Streptosporangium sp. NPDC000396]|uniref:MBL fold metallo-hydrolase n=1 Tax=Streptosporangium sp. NPDC000396 TaxID=3366185 RepID=UPI0036C8ECA3
MTERPPGYIAPNLSPVGLELYPDQLADGVYALMANQMPKDNNGLVIGEKAALVIDSGVTPGVGRHIQDVAANLTDKPIRYLANTTYHGDHTFGNTAFADDVTIFSSRINKAAMTDLAGEKRIRTDSMYGDGHVLDEVVAWRTPDVVFDRFCEIDLGGRVVQLWHFGPGNGSGDTVVYVPDAKVAWTGNLLGPAGTTPMLLVGDPLAYGRTLRAMKASLALDTVIPGHGFRAEAEPAISWLVTYLERLAGAVSTRIEEGEPVERMLEEIPLRDALEIPPGFPGADQVIALQRSLHRLNILLTHRWLQGVAR